MLGWWKSRGGFNNCRKCNLAKGKDVKDGHSWPQGPRGTNRHGVLLVVGCSGLGVLEEANIGHFFLYCNEFMCDDVISPIK